MRRTLVDDGAHDFECGATMSESAGYVDRGFFQGCCVLLQTPLAIAVARATFNVRVSSKSFPHDPWNESPILWNRHFDNVAVPAFVPHV
jgi:hypothetical protein